MLNRTLSRVLELAHKQVRETEYGRINEALVSTYKRMDNRWLEKNTSFVLTLQLFFFFKQKDKVGENSCTRDLIIHNINETELK